MVSYFSEDLAENASRGLVNRISDAKLLGEIGLDVDAREAAAF